MHDNIESKLPALLDWAKQIQRERMIERTEAESLLLQASLLESFFKKEHQEIMAADASNS